jgi:hypothetical protein
MKMSHLLIRFKVKKPAKQALLATLALLALVGCDDGEAIKKRSDSQPAINFTIEKIQDIPVAQIPKDDSGIIYINNVNFTASGTCSGAISGKIDVKVSSALAPIDCQADGTWSYATTFETPTNANGQIHYLDLDIYNKAGNYSQTSRISLTVVVDTIAPDAPVLNAPQGCNLVSGVYECSQPNVFMIGDYGNMAQLPQIISGPAEGHINQTGANFEFSTILAPGQTRILDFVAKDLAGNTSGISSLTVSLSNYTTSILVSAIVGGGTNGLAPGAAGVSVPKMFAAITDFSGQMIDSVSTDPVELRAQMLSGVVAIGSQE